MGVFSVFEGCCRVFEVCLKGVWKNKIEVQNNMIIIKESFADKYILPNVPKLIVAFFICSACAD